MLKHRSHAKSSQNNFKWINYVESILNRAGLDYIFINQVGYCD